MGERIYFADNARRPVEPELALIVFEMQLVVKQKAYFFVERFFVEAVLFENKPAARPLKKTRVFKLLASRIFAQRHRDERNLQARKLAQGIGSPSAYAHVGGGKYILHAGYKFNLSEMSVVKTYVNLALAANNENIRARKRVFKLSHGLVETRRPETASDRKSVV